MLRQSRRLWSIATVIIVTLVLALHPVLSCAQQQPSPAADTTGHSTLAAPAEGQRDSTAVDSIRSVGAGTGVIVVDTLGRADVSPDSVLPIVDTTQHPLYDPRANMVRVEGRELDWPQSRRESKPGAVVPLKRKCGGFLMDRTEVTNRDFAFFLSAADSNRKFFDPRMDIVATDAGHLLAKHGREGYPVVYVDWVAAYAFSNWAGKSLPTEEEWMAGALAGRTLTASDTAFPWGNSPPDSTRGNYLKTAGFPGRVAVGSYPQGAAPNGIADLAGNVAEWTLTERELNLPAGGSHSWMVVKGGSFLDPAANLSITSRAFRDRSERLGSLGFRCIFRYQPPK